MFQRFEIFRSGTISLLYFRQFFLARLEYKWDFLASLFASAVSAAMGIVFVLFLLEGSGVSGLGGWSSDQVLFIYGYAGIATAAFAVVAPNLYQFGDKYIIQGQFDRVLTRPLSSLLQVLSETFNLDALGNLLVGFITLGVATVRLNLSFSFFDFIWIIFSGLCGAVILLSVFIIVASLSFHFEDRLGISAPVFNLVAFGRYPLNVFNRTIQFFLSWIIPFAFVGFYPATYFFSEQMFHRMYLLTPIMAAATATVAGLLWRLGVRSYSSTGN